MFKLRGISTAQLTSKLISPQSIAVFGVVVLLLVFIGYKTWQEYQTYRINQMFADFPTAAGVSNQVVLTWQDDSTNEDGFLVERKSDGSYTGISFLPANTTSYTDYAVTAGVSYCYRIGSYNQAGTAYSDEFCIDIPEAIVTEPEPNGAEEPVIPGDTTIVFEFIEKPVLVELNGREFYGFKSAYSFNTEFSVDEIRDIDFLIGDGSLAYRDSTYFIFEDQAIEIESGHAAMPFSDLNSFSFTLQGSGNSQVASLYMAAGAWAPESAGIIVSAGDQTKVIMLPSSSTWYYMRIDIAFDQSTVVNVVPTGSYGGYSGLMMGGVVLNNANQYEQIPVIDEPVIDEPVIDEPVIEEPVIDEPVIDEPVIDEPVIEEPVIDEPVIEDPVIDEPVIDEPVIEEPVIDVTAPAENIVQVEFIDAPVAVELSGREFYGVKNGNYYNTEFSAEEITDINFSIGSGSLAYRTTYFTFADQSIEVESGHIGMLFNELNKFSFTLRGSGSEQIASLYMAAGAWTSEAAGLIVQVNDKTEIITLPSNRSWHYMKIDIPFNQLTQVEITPTGSYGSYSGIMVAGITLNQSSEPLSYTLLQSIDMQAGLEIDVTNVKYVTSQGISANTDASSAEVLMLEYAGKVKYRDRDYTFVDNGIVVEGGYTGMAWAEAEAVQMAFKSATDKATLASLYFRAGAWSEEKPLLLELIINGESFPVELPQGYKWFSIKTDIEFSGEMDVELRPVGNYASYSQLFFAGVTLK